MTCEAASKQKEIKYLSSFQVYDLIASIFRGTEYKRVGESKTVKFLIKIRGVKKLEPNKGQRHKFLPAESITYYK